jgi:hypothetical protein
LTDYSKASPFADNSTIVVGVGHLTAESNRPESFEFIAPTTTGVYEYKFRYGIEGQGLFGETFTISLNVTE